MASATHQADGRAEGGRGRAASSPAGHGHLHPRGRDGRAQLVQVPDARSAGVAAVHLGWRRRGLVRRPHPELGQTKVSEPSSRQPGMGVEGGGRGRRAEAARGKGGGRERGRRTRAKPRGNREPVLAQAEAAGEVAHGAPGFPAPSLQAAAPAGDNFVILARLWVPGSEEVGGTRPRPQPSRRASPGRLGARLGFCLRLYTPTPASWAATPSSCQSGVDGNVTQFACLGWKLEVWVPGGVGAFACS